MAGRVPEALLAGPPLGTEIAGVGWVFECLPDAHSMAALGQHSSRLSKNRSDVCR